MYETNLVLILLLSTFILYLPNINGASVDNVKTLHADLMYGYNRYVRPVTNQTKAVNVYVGLSIIALQEFDEVHEKFSFVGVFRVLWTDENLKWDPANHSGINEVFMGYKDVWVPEIILTNPSEKLDSFGKDWQLIRYNSYGVASWYPGDLIKATCAIDAYYFPFDIQECTLEVYAWGYAYQEVELVALTDFVETALMSEHGSWSLIQTKARAEVVSHTSKASFVFRFVRKPQYIIVNVMLPVVFLCLLNVLVFLLPAESGERISYSITVLLSIAVFMTIVSDTLPKTSEPLPLISYYMMTALSTGALITFLAILNMRLFHSRSDSAVPNWLFRIYKRLRACCANKLKRNWGHNSSTTEKNCSTPVTETKRKSTNKIEPLDPQLHNVLDYVSNETPVTWQDISVFVDYVSLIVSTSVTVLTFSVFLIITRVSSK